MTEKKCVFLKLKNGIVNFFELEKRHTNSAYLIFLIWKKKK